MKKLLYTLFLLTFLTSNSWCQVADPCRKSTEGKDFWFGFMESRNYNTNHYVEVTVTAREATTFTITIGKEETPFNKTYSVAANDSRQVEIPWSMVEALNSETIENKGIHLVSENPVNVYALNYDRNSADVAVIYPTASLGNEYFAMCYEVNISEYDNGSYRNGRNSEFLVVATEDSTNVLIIPSKVTDKLVAAGDSILILLNKGEVYQIQSKNRNNLTGQGDLTQSYVQSDKPIAFYSGSLATTVPAYSGTSAWDHLYEQIPPIHSWGREYYTVPLKSRDQDLYRIMAAEDNTTITISNKSNISLNRGEYKEIVLYSNQPSRIFADKPIMVAQYSQSNNVDGTGDPFMIILSSVTQSKNDVTFVAYDSDIIQNYFVNIITLSTEVNNIRYNGNSIASSFQPFSEGDYSYAQINTSPGTHRIYNTNEDRGFLAYVYGYGGVESYGYGVGFNLDLVLDLGESINFNGDTLLLCHGETITLDAGPYFDTYYWRNTNDTTQTLEINSGGEYHVTTTTVDGCVLEDSIYVLVSKPEIDLGILDTKECSPFSMPINPINGFEEYIWFDINHDTLSTNQNIIIDSTNTYILNAFNELGCPARDTINLVVYPVPKVEISGNKLLCGIKNSELAVSITDAPDSVWNYPGSYKWTSNNPGVTITNQSHKAATITATDWGSYEIYYTLTTSDLCITGDTFLVQFQPTPTSDFIFVDNPDDECEGYTREILYTGNATKNANFHWDYGGSKVIDSMNWNNFTVSLGAYNTNPYITLYVEENTCWSDTISKLLGANPDFVLETENARGCDSMTVLFRGELNVDDDLLFEWDFGDGSPISNKQEIEHFYSSVGFYDVSLLITNNLSGCQIGFQIDSMIKVFPTPTADITVDASICYPDSAMLSYTHFIDSSICNWNFEGAHQSGNENDSIIMIIDEPFGKAILTVDEYGCVSPPAEITLKRLPHFNFHTEFEEGCQPYSPEIVADPEDENLNFTWLSDSLPNPVGNSAIYLFPDSGRMNVSLMATSLETGCFDTLSKADWIWVHPKPIAAFEVDYPVALLEHADITFSNYSEFASFYSWNFGDDVTSIEADPIHTYTQLGDYNAQLFIESEYTCRDTAALLIKILPFTVFTPTAFRPDSEIEVNRTFMPVGVGADPAQFSIKIFDRWGQIMYETNSPENPWEGTTKNGKPAPMGNYIWISHYFDIQGFEHNQKGQVVLVR